MDVTPDKMIKQLADYIKSLSKKKKTIVFGAIAGIIVTVVLVAILINSLGYVTLYSGLSSSEAGEIVVRLNELGVESKLESDGTILVPKDQEAQLKMTLATEGYPQSTLNYDIFSTNSGYMTTDYEKKQYLLFQLQNRLQDAIMTLDSVENAIVTISLPEEDSYVLSEDEVPATASVVLDLEGNVELNSSQINGIEELVAKSVTGLDGENVAIVDSNGNILNEKSDDGTGSTSYTRLDLESSISQELEDKISALFQSIYGSDAVRVAVSATVDIRKSVSEETTYTPVVDDSGVVSNQDVSQEYTSDGTTSGGTVGTDSNTGVTVYEEVDEGEDTGVISSNSSTDYLVNSLIEQIERDGYEIQSISAAVLINTTTLTQDQISTYKEMVAAASGISADNINIAGTQFASAEETTAPTDTAAAGLSMIQLILIAAGGLLLLILLLAFILIRKKRKKSQSSQGGRNPKIKIETNYADVPSEIVISETREQGLKRQVQELSSSNPDIVAQLLRTWIKEDEDGYE